MIPWCLILLSLFLHWGEPFRTISKPLCKHSVTGLYLWKKTKQIDRGRRRVSGPVSVLVWSDFTAVLRMDRDEHREQQRWGGGSGVMDGEWEFAGLFITWILGVGRARDGAALGWTDASPKRNHRISSTQEERPGEERKSGKERKGT